MPAGIDKAHSLLKLLTSIGLTADEMICCGDGYNDLTMIETAGLGVAMANAQPAVLDKADYITPVSYTHLGASSESDCSDYGSAAC